LGAGWLAVGAVTGIAILAVIAAPSESRAFATRLAILAVGIVAGWRVLGRATAVTASSPERFEDGLRQPRAAPFEIAGLRSVDTDVRMATANAFGVEYRLKPVLRELARWRLERNHGINLDREPDAARGVLGEPLWQLTQPVDVFSDFRAPGITLAAVQAAVDRLEQI
jgi:hypothetical protein